VIPRRHDSTQLHGCEFRFSDFGGSVIVEGQENGVDLFAELVRLCSRYSL